LKPAARLMGAAGLRAHPHGIEASGLTRTIPTTENKEVRTMFGQQTITREVAPVLPAFETVDGLIHEWVETVASELSTMDDCYDFRVEEIENEARSGFFPFTEGGWEGIVYATLWGAYSSGSIPAVIQPFIDSSLNDCQEEWDRENPEHPYSWLFEDDAEDQGQVTLLGKSTEREHWREKFYEFETEWMSSGDTYFYKVRAIYYGPSNHRNESGEPEVFLMVGINTDFEYGRDHIPWLSYYGSDPHCTKWLWEKNIPVSQVTPEIVKTMIKDAIGKGADA
jgi:hypothetical protein